MASLVPKCFSVDNGYVSIHKITTYQKPEALLAAHSESSDGCQLRVRRGR